MTHILVAALSIAVGMLAGLWWVRPDIEEMKAKIEKLEKENTRYRKHILRNFKVRVTRNGVDVDTE
jgi:cell division protein FtsL